MTSALEQLLSSEVLSEEVRSTLSEAWESKLSEAREDITVELREEFAQRYETDKTQMVEALDAMLSDTIRTELTEFAIDKKEAINAKVQYQKDIADHAELLESFIVESLKDEIVELRKDRSIQEGNFQKLEGFVMEQLTSELNDFHQDKKDLLRQKVKLVKEGKEIIAKTKEEFISRASTKLASIVESTISTELGTLKEDIQNAKENMFGRKIFETFAAEFMSSHLSEGTQISKLNNQLHGMKSQLAESYSVIKTTQGLVESKDKKINRLVELKLREKSLNDLMKPLATEKRKLMTNLLESVATNKLSSAFDKYLPHVLNETTVASKTRNQLNEAQTTEITGNKANTYEVASNEAEIINLRKLAGIK
jgi:hypothetical protein